mgnify:CR=1 FL=1
MENREKFSSRLGFILISAGCAIGLGNVWRFPYITGKYGGGLFVLIYLFFLLAMGLPIVIMEFANGRASQKSIAKSFDVLEPEGSKWHLYKYFGIAGNYILMMFYTTVAGWMLAYFFKMFKGEFVKKQGLQFQNTKNANDVFFVRSALALAKRITVTKKRLITYRYNDGSNTQSRKSQAPVEFYKAFKALKEDLIKRGIFKKVERSYVNMVLSESLFNLRTAGSREAQETVENLLLNEGFQFFELDKYDESYFYNKKEYREYKELIEKQ